MGFGLAKYDAGATTRRLVLDEISVDPKRPIVLLVRIAGEPNKDWDNYQFKRRGAPSTAKPAAEGTPELRAHERAEQAKVLSATVIVGWENVVEDGAEVAWSPDAALRFLAELYEHCPDVWYRLLIFVHRIDNFRAPEVDPVDLGKG